jgi:hypothetical protein
VLKIKTINLLWQEAGKVVTFRLWERCEHLELFVPLSSRNLSNNPGTELLKRQKYEVISILISWLIIFSL